MSVTTTADEQITEAKEHIKKACKCLNIATDEDTWGSCEFNNKYLEKLESIEMSLRKLKRKL